MGNFSSSDSEIKLFKKFANFPKNSFVGSIWNLKLVYDKKQTLKQLFWKKKQTYLWKILDNLYKRCIFADFDG